MACAWQVRYETKKGKAYRLALPFMGVSLFLHPTKEVTAYLGYSRGNEVINIIKEIHVRGLLLRACCDGHGCHLAPCENQRYSDQHTDDCGDGKRLHGFSRLTEYT